ncbi:MAG: TAXI family TRAP transporter solute-binding subunit [Bauldia sp.]|uniref:TAXI family TRAP transporter solute-binding subunit n=1 Tax=Bauldia sp. TaxID=2575872 RepID=UPI001DAD51D5|nr:TAXI family TRAP transporter solute-binding subunit [Bauldia sp.]MCB1495025.1 TAXI family TRAP transporter solute-binding subunit [Bauldia sp.]
MRLVSITGLRRAVIGAAVSAGLALAAAMSPAAAEEVSIASGTTGGLYHPAAGAICKLVNEHTAEHGITCTVAFGNGSVANIQSLRAGETTFAMAQSDTGREAMLGTGPFVEAGPYDALRSVMSLFVEQVTIVTRRDKDIRSFADLKGKRVYPSSPGSGGYLLMQALFEAEGWGPDDIIEIAEDDLTAPDIAQSLCDNEVDAFSVTVGHPSPLVKEAAETCDVVLIPVAGPAVDALIAGDALYARSAIPGGMYRGNPQDIPGLGLVATLVTTADADADVVYALTKAYFEGMDRLREASPLFSSLTVEQMARDGLSAPLHEGAARFFAEAGLR